MSNAEKIWVIGGKNKPLVNIVPTPNTRVGTISDLPQRRIPIVGGKQWGILTDLVRRTNPNLNVTRPLFLQKVIDPVI